MTKTQTNRALASCLGMILIACSTQQTVQADSLIWGGQSSATGNWSDPLNWTNSASANVAPNNGDSLFFPWTVQTTSTNDFPALTVSSLTYSNSSFDFTGNLLTITGGITNTTAAAGDNAFDLPLTLGGAQTFEVDSGSLTFDDAITDGGNALAITGTGNVNLYGQLSGAGSLTMFNSGTLLITNKQPLTGGITVNSGTVQFAPTGNLVFGGAITPSLITINPGGTVYNSTVHAIGGGTPLFINGGIWELDAEDYKQTLTMQDGTIQAGPNVSANGGEIRPGLSGAAGPYTWYFTNSVSGSVINNPINTEPGSVPVNLILDVARGLAASDLTLNGALKNGGNITVVRNGITTLTGPNTQSGTFTIAGGTVVLQNTLLSSVITIASNAVFDISSAGFSLNNNQALTGSGSIVGTLNDNNAGVTGAVLAPGGNGVAGTLAMGGLSLSGNGLQLNFNIANTTGVGGGTNSLLVVTNFSANAGITNTVNFSFLNGAPAAGTYTIIQYINPFGGDPSQFLTASASRYSYTFTNNLAANAIQVIVSGSPGNLVWTGDNVTNSWDVNTSSNWLIGVAGSLFLQGDNVTFNDSGSANPPVNLVGSVQPTTVTVNATKNYVFAGSGSIASGRLIKSNSGNLTILTPNSNTGGGSLNGAGLVNVGNGDSIAANLGSGPLTNNTKVTFFESASPTYAGNMSGTGSLTAFMPGSTLTLTGTNTFTGGLTIANGTVQIGNNTAGVSPSVTGNITNYGTLNLYRSDAFTNQNNITSAGNTLEYGNGDVNVRGTGGMTVDGTASINALPAGSLSIGQSAAGFMTVNPGAVINVGLNYLLGNPNAAGDYGVVIQNGGAITVGNQVRIGHWASEVSTNIMNGGTLSVPNNQLAVGWDGVGLMTMSGGTVNCRSLTVDDDGYTAPINGLNSVFTMNGGQLNIGVNGIGGNVQTNGDVNNIRLGGGTIAAAAPAGFSSSMSMVLTNNGPTFDTTNTAITLSGVLSGSGTLTKIGSGYLNLNGTNTYTNSTIVVAGTLQGSGTVVGPITVQSGANLSAGGTFATGTLTTSNLTMNTGANLVMDASSTSSNSDLVYVRGALTLGSATPLALNFLGGTPYTANAYTVVSNLPARTGHLVLAPSSLTRYAGTVDESNPNCIRVSFSGTNANLVWQGNVSTNWNVNTDANWLNVGVADKYYQSDVVLFDDTGISKSNVNLSATMTPASVSVDTAGIYTFAGSPIGGVTALTKSGPGQLTLLNSNVYTGLTTIANGTLQVGNGGTSGYLAGPTVDDYGSLVFNRSDTVIFNGAINGPGRLVQAGSGTLLITATQNHYGGTLVNPGSTVQLGNGALADAGSLGNGLVTNNGTINFYRLSSIAVATPYTGGGAFNFLGTGNSGQSAYSMNATNTFTGPVTLNLARLQSGVGAQSFGNPSSIMVNPGSAVYAVATPQSPIYNLPLTLNGTGWQDGLGALRMEGNGIWAGNLTLAANSRIAVTSASTNTISGTIGGNYELETYGNNAAGALVLAPSAANSYSALRVSIGTAGTKTIAGNNNAIPNNIPLTMNGGTLWLNGFGKTFSPFLNLSASSSLQNGSTISTANVTLAPVLGSSSYSGTFADGATQPLNVTFTQAPGLWTLALPTASPNWTGNLTNNGGTISSGTQNTPFGSQGVVGRNLVGNNGAVFLTTINNVLNGYDGNVVLNNSTWICNRYISMAPNAGYLYLANSTITGTNSSDANYENWSLPSTVTVRGTSPSYLLGGGSSSAFDLQSGGTTFDVADVTGNPNSDLIVGGGSSTTFLHSPANTTSGGSLIKIGAGTLELDGVNPYTGSTTINAGTIALGASGTIARTATITIASGAKLDVSAVSGALSLNTGQTLTGSGTVVGSLDDGSGTAILPGGGGTAGTLTVTTNLTLEGSCVYGFDLANTTGSGNDKIVVGGNLTLPSGTPTTLNFNFLNGAPALGTPYTLFQCGNITGTAVTGLTNNATRYSVTYGQTANAITVTFNGGASNLVWTGTDPITPATWDVAGSTNWFDGSTGDVFYQFDTVRFDNTSANNTVNLNATVTPAGITVDSTNNYTFTGTGGIGGTTGITKNNTNTLFLGTGNTFTGPVVISGGKVADGVNGDEILAPGVNVIVSNNAAFDWNGGSGNFTTYGHTFVIAGAGPDGNGAVVSSVDDGGEDNYTSISNLILTADSVVGGIERWDIGSDPNSKLDGQGHRLTVVGTGNGKIDIRSQIITNVASITISNPLTFYESFNQTNPWTLGTTNFVEPGSRLGVYGGFQFNLPIELDGGAITNQGGGTPAWLSSINVASNSTIADGGAQNFYGIISGPGSLGIGGMTTAGTIPGLLTFSNANTYTGGTVISNAPVTITNTGAIAGLAAVEVANPNGLGTGPVTFDLSQMSTNALTNTARVLEISVTGGGVVPNAINLPASGVTNLSIQGRDSTSVFTLAGQMSGGYAALTNRFDSGTAGSVGVIRLANNANNFVASTIYVPRGELAITGDGCLGNAANLLKLDQGVAAVTTANGLRFDAAGVNLAHNLLANSGAALDLFGDNTGSGVPNTVNNATISGIISGSGTIYVRGTNSTLTLSGLNPYSGGFELQQPVTLQVSASTNLGTAYVAIKAGSTFRYTGTGSETMTRTLWSDGGGTLGGGTIDIPSATASLTWNPGGGTLNQGVTKTGAGALTYGTQSITGGIVTENGGTFTVNSAISGASTFVQVNSGTLILAAANTYNGSTVVNGGTLVVNGSLPAGNMVSVASGGTLGGSGTINCPVTTFAGAGLQPGGGGSTVGKLTINSTLNLGGTTTMYLNKSALTNSQVAGLSTVVYGGVLNVFNLGGTYAAGDKFTLFAAGDRAGSFVTVNLPALAGGLGWSNSLAMDGSIRVVTTVSTSPTQITTALSGNTLTLSWPMDHTGWRLLVQTNNLAAGLSNNTNDWTTVPGSTAIDQTNIVIDPTKPSEFYRLVYP